MGDATLRPLTLDDVAAIEAVVATEAHDAFNWTGHREPGWLRAAVEERRTLTDEAGRLAVVGGSELAGYVSWHRVRTGSSSYSWCWSIGIVLLPDCRGQGYGTAAQRALAAYLFATTPAHRVEAGTETGNVAEQRALEKAGFRREGLMRGYAWRAGAWRDGLLYAVIRGEL